MGPLYTRGVTAGWQREDGTRAAKKARAMKKIELIRIVSMIMKLMRAEKSVANARMGE